MAYFVYILFCDRKTFYVGITNNIGRRIGQHKDGYSPTTKKFSKIDLVYREKFYKRSVAESRERQLKGWSVAKKKALISGDKESLIKLSKSRQLADTTRG